MAEKRESEELTDCRRYDLGHKSVPVGPSPYVGIVYYRCTWCNEYMLGPSPKRGERGVAR